MSGVFGTADCKRRSTSTRLRRMAESLRLTDWTRTQVWTDEQAGVGLGQVNIGIFSTDAQPLVGEERSLVLAFYGELYYTESLRRRLVADGYLLELGTEAELILRLYQARGIDFVGDLEGVFVLALWDGKRECLLVANDRFGLIPTYYAHYDGRLVFAPQVRGILADATFDKRLDLTGLAQFLRFQRLLGDRTFFQGLHLLPYGSVLAFDQRNDTLNVSHYWDFDQVPAWPKDATFENAVAETGRLLRRAVEARTEAQHRVGVYLSGGLDSRTLLALTSQVHSSVPSLTYGVPGCRDLAYAERIARRVGSPHRSVLLDDGRWVRDEVDLHLDITEGFVTWTHCHAAKTLPLARELIDVNLTGFNGDQLLGARAIEHALPTADSVDDLDFSARMYRHFTQDFSWPGLTEIEARFLLTDRFYSQIRDRAFESLTQALTAVEEYEYSRRIDYLAAVHHGNRLSNMNVVYQRAYFEARYPFCDYDLLDWVYSMPTDYRLNDRLYLAVINREIPEVTWIPRDTDGQLLTNHMLIRKTHGMWQRARRRILQDQRRIISEDPEGWLRRDLRSWAEHLLFSPRTLERGFYNPDFLRTLFERHMAGSEVHTIGKIAPIMTYEMMLRRFYD